MLMNFGRPVRVNTRPNASSKETFKTGHPNFILKYFSMRKTASTKLEMKSFLNNQVTWLIQSPIRSFYQEISIFKNNPWPICVSKFPPKQTSSPLKLNPCYPSSHQLRSKYDVQLWSLPMLPKFSWCVRSSCCDRFPRQAFTLFLFYTFHHLLYVCRSDLKHSINWNILNINARIFWWSTLSLNVAAQDFFYTGYS